MNDFDVWNEIKKRVHNEQNLRYYPKEGDVRISIFGTNIGFEQNGTGRNFSRPALVIKKFNSHMFWVVPLSTKEKQLDFYYYFIDPNGNRASAILAQLKLVSAKRLKRRLYRIGAKQLLEIKEKLKGFL